MFVHITPVQTNPDEALRRAEDIIAHGAFNFLFEDKDAWTLWKEWMPEFDWHAIEGTCLGFFFPWATRREMIG